MSVKTAVARLREIAAEWSAGDPPVFHPPATSNSLEAFAAELGCPLPEELAEFLRQTDAVVAMEIHNGYWLGGTEQLSRSVKRGDWPRLIDGLLAIPVATDGGGHAFLISATGDRVWRRERETGSWRVVAESFSRFLERVAADWVAFENQVPNWTFLT